MLLVGYKESVVSCVYCNWLLQLTFVRNQSLSKFLRRVNNWSFCRHRGKPAEPKTTILRLGYLRKIIQVSTCIYGQKVEITCHKYIKFIHIVYIQNNITVNKVGVGDNLNAIKIDINTWRKYAWRMFRATWLNQFRPFRFRTCPPDECKKQRPRGEHTVLAKKKHGNRGGENGISACLHGWNTFTRRTEDNEINRRVLNKLQNYTEAVEDWYPRPTRSSAAARQPFYVWSWTGKWHTSFDTHGFGQPCNGPPPMGIIFRNFDFPSRERWSRQTVKASRNEWDG